MLLGNIVAQHFSFYVFMVEEIFCYLIIMTIKLLMNRVSWIKRHTYLLGDDIFLYAFYWDRIFYLVSCWEHFFEVCELWVQVVRDGALLVKCYVTKTMCFNVSFASLEIVIKLFMSQEGLHVVSKEDYDEELIGELDGVDLFQGFREVTAMERPLLTKRHGCKRSLW